MQKTKLDEHYKQLAYINIRDLFTEDAGRFDKFSLTASDLFLDYSKNRVTKETISLLCKLAEDSNLDKHIEAMFSGQKINTTEKRAVLHTALRNPEQSLTPEIRSSRKKMLQCAENIRNEKTITDPKMQKY